MTTIAFVSRATNDIIDHYIETRRKSDMPVSTGQAIRAIRAALPKCDLTDRQLTDMVAAAAIRGGRNVNFDTAA